MYSYTISKSANAEVFRETCNLIEQHYPQIKKDPLLEDVDGSLVQIYRIEEGQIRVESDFQVDAVYADSDRKLAFLERFLVKN